MNETDYMKLKKGDKVIITGYDVANHNSIGFAKAVKDANHRLIAKITSFDYYNETPTIVIDAHTKRYGPIHQSVMIQFVQKFKEPKDYDDSDIMER